MGVHQSRGVRAGIVAAAAVVLIGVATTTASDAAWRPETRATGPAVVSAASGQAHTLPAPGMKTIESIALTAGTWSIFARATAVDPGGTDFFRCQLVATSPTNVLDGSTSQLTHDVPRDVLTNLAVLTTATAVTVRQRCGHDGDAGDAGEIDAGAGMLAFTTAPASVRVARTSAQTPLGNGVPVGVENLSLPKGTWVIAAKLSPVDLSVSDADATCHDDVGEFRRAVGTALSDHAVSTILQVGTIPALTAPTTITLTCESDSDGMYLDPNSVFWAWKASDLASVASASPDACPLTLTGSTTNDALVLDQQNCDIGVGSFPSQMTGVTLRAGTWVAIGAYDDLVSRQVNVARCQLVNVSRGKQLDSASATLPPTIARAATGITNLAVITVAKKLAVEARCGEDDPGDPGRVLDSGWAFIRP